MLFLSNLDIVQKIIKYNASEIQVMNYLELDLVQYNILQSVQNVPNIFLPLLTGYVVQFLGSQRTLIFTACLLVIGQILSLVAVLCHIYWLYLVGRFFVGIGFVNN